MKIKLGASVKIYCPLLTGAMLIKFEGAVVNTKSELVEVFLNSNTVLITPSVLDNVLKGKITVEPTCPSFGGKATIPSIKKVAVTDKPSLVSIL